MFWLRTWLINYKIWLLKMYLHSLIDDGISIWYLQEMYLHYLGSIISNVWLWQLHMANYINSNYGVHKMKSSKKDFYCSIMCWMANQQCPFGRMGLWLVPLGDILGWVLFLVLLFLGRMWLWFVLVGCVIGCCMSSQLLRLSQWC